VDVIDIGNTNTVRTLRDQLARLVRAGYADTGFPILNTDANGKSRMLGFIGGNELEHALSTFLRISSYLPRAICGFAHVLVLIHSFFFSGIVADEADHPIFFHSDSGQRFRRRTLSSSSMSSLIDGAEDPFNFSVYMDKVYRSAVNSLPTFFAHESRASCRLR
jgi:chloride channel 3/4/5